MIEAVRRLKSQGVRCEVVLIGDGPMREEIERRIRELQLQDCITLAGAAPTDAMIRLIESSRALVLASFAENFPSVIMEAFGLGRPVIATYVGGIPELVEPGKSGGSCLRGAWMRWRARCGKRSPRRSFVWKRWGR